MRFKRILKSSIAAMTAVMLLVMTGCNEAKETSSYEVSDINVAQVNAYNDFAMRITKQLLTVSDDKNMFISPLSMTFALSLVVNGAEGTTRDELLNLIGTEGQTLAALNEGNNVLRDLLEHGDKDVEVNIANALWTREGTQLLADYSKRMKLFYEAEVSELDFEDPGASNQINRWVKKKTDGLIDQMVDPGMLKSSVMVLMNAIYFNGNWAVAFKKSATYDAPFYLADGSEINVKMMKQNEILSYKENDSYKAVRLPYGDGNWGMIVVLPNEGIALSEVEEELLTEENFWRDGFTEGKSIVGLPRFTIKDQKSLTDGLKALGVKHSFSSETADFSAMTKNSAGLYISDMMQKSFIEVNESGTKAAAVTSLLMAGSAEPSKSPFELIADRPFFFAIADRTTGAIAFLGRVMNPAEN